MDVASKTETTKPSKRSLEKDHGDDSSEPLKSAAEAKRIRGSEQDRESKRDDHEARINSLEEALQGQAKALSDIIDLQTEIQEEQQASRNFQVQSMGTFKSLDWRDDLLWIVLSRCNRSGSIEGREGREGYQVGARKVERDATF